MCPLFNLLWRVETLIIWRNHPEVLPALLVSEGAFSYESCSMRFWRLQLAGAGDASSSNGPKKVVFFDVGGLKCSTTRNQEVLAWCVCTQSTMSMSTKGATSPPLDFGRIFTTVLIRDKILSNIAQFDTELPLPQASKPTMLEANQHLLQKAR